MNAAESNPTGETAPASAGDGLTFTTRGGPGSIYADLDAIEALTLRCETAADDAVRIAANLESVMVHLDPARCATPIVGILQDRLWDGMGEIRRLADRLFAQHRALGPTVEAYRRAEQGAAAVIDAQDPGSSDLPRLLQDRAADGLSVEDSEFLLRSASEVAGEKALALSGEGAIALAFFGSGPAAGGGMPAAARENAAFRGSSPFAPALGAVADVAADHVEALRLTPGEAVELAAQGGLGSMWLPSAPLVLAEPPTPLTGGPARLEGSLAEVVSLIPRAPDGEGAITVTQVRSESGTDSWIVGLPGTQGGLLPQPGSENWVDGTGNVEALGEGSSHVADGVARALQAAGVPAGADIVMTGYSQGGVHALNLAERGPVATGYAVRGVVTVGSPSGNRPTPHSVPVLEFESDRDTYTAADGGPNPVGPMRATVTLRPAGGQGAPALLAPGSGSRAAWDAPRGKGWAGEVVAAAGVDMDCAHDLDQYTRMIAGFESSDPPARAEVAVLQATLAAGTTGVVVSRHSVRMRRRRLSEPAPPLFSPEG